MTYDLLTIVNAIERAAKRIAELLKDPPLHTTQSINATGDQVKEVDIRANQIFIDELSTEANCGGLASEELTEPRILGSGRYLVFFDPIDGSSNIGINTVGSIFSVIKLKNNNPITESDFLQSGKNIVLAGYVLYGAETIMVLASHGVVKQYHLQEEFVLRQTEIKCPSKGKIVSINSGNYRGWDNKTAEWFDTILEYGKSVFRYSGTFVADMHKILHSGGIFAYPADNKNKLGKIRIMFEAAPMAYILEAAGGNTTNGSKKILDLVPYKLHSCTPIYIGSKENVDDAK